MKRYKRIFWILIELMYVLFNLAFLFYMYNNYALDRSLDFGFNQTIFHCLALGMVGITLISGPLLNRLFTYVYNLAFAGYLISQKIYLDAFKQYYRAGYALSLTNEVAGVKDSVMEFIHLNDFMPIIILTIANIIFIIMFFALERKAFTLKTRLVIALVSILLGVGCLYPIRGNIKKMEDDILAMNNGMAGFLYSDDYYLYQRVSNTNEFVDKYGILTFAYRDLQTLNETVTVGPEEEAEIRNLLTSRPEHLTANDYTGIFADKNILFVQAESFMNVAIDPDLTPTIAWIRDASLKVSNFLTPMLAGSTSDTEFMANTSFIPNSSDQASCYDFDSNTFETTLAKMFKDNGYIAIAYHNNYASYYNRGVIFKTFGYDGFLDSYEMGVESCTPDSDVAEHIAWCYAGASEKHMEYWITYSGHQPYDYSATGVKDECVEAIRNKYPELEEAYVAYLAKAMDLDQALRTYITIYSYFHNLNDLVIVFYGDHQAKGLDLGRDSAFYAQTGRDYDPEFECTGLYFFNGGDYAGEFNKTATVLDMLPTVANLFGFEIDNQTILGHDMFDENYLGMYFSDQGSWKTDSVSYSITTGLYTDHWGNELTGSEKDAAEKQINGLRRVKELSKLILQTDYFGDK